MKPLVAIISCHSRAHYADAQRLTWIPSLGLDYKFFFGQPSNVYLARKQEHDDEVWLHVKDDYYSLADKVQRAIKWGLEHGYQRMFFADDDTYIMGENLRLALEDWQPYEYVGRQRPDALYLSGAAYYLGYNALLALAGAATPSTIKRDYGMPAFPYVEGWLHHVLRVTGHEQRADKRIKFSNVAAEKHVEHESIDAGTVADFEWSGLEMFARHNYNRDAKIIPSVEWRLRNLESSRQALAEKIF